MKHFLARGCPLENSKISPLSSRRKASKQRFKEEGEEEEGEVKKIRK